MKRVLLLILSFLFALTITGSLCEGERKYSAITSLTCHLRRTPDGPWVTEVPNNGKIQVIEWGDDWCYVAYKEIEGYCKTSWLYMLRSLDPYLYPLPRTDCYPTGYIVMTEDTLIQAGDFDGTTVSSGEKVCASYLNEDICVLPVWRSEQTVDMTSVEYHPFASWDAAEPGDIIGGFTTYYSSRQGKKHPAEREANIVLGCTRINDCTVASGDLFSFNAYCAPYRKYNGYGLAPNISAKGEGYGGGVCQVTTTLYNAVITLPLLINEWNVHQYDGVPYIPQFYDAAVGNLLDFTFTNTLPYPIRIQAGAANGVIDIFIVRAE